MSRILFMLNVVMYIKKFIKVLQIQRIMIKQLIIRYRKELEAYQI